MHLQFCTYILHANHVIAKLGPGQSHNRWFGGQSPTEAEAFWHLKNTILSIICSYVAEFKLRFYVLL